LGALDLALELRAQHGHRGARAPCKPPEGAHDAGQVLGPRDDEREHGDQHQLSESDLEHLLRLVVVAVLLDAPVLLGLAFLHRILEAFHRAAEIGTDVAQAPGAEDEHDDGKDDEQLPETDSAKSHDDVSPLERRSGPDVEPAHGKKFLQAADTVVTGVKDAGDHRAVRQFTLEYLGEVLRFAGAAGDHQRRAADRGDVLDQGKVKPLAGAVAIQAGEHDLAYAHVHQPLHPFARIQAAGLAAAMRHHFPGDFLAAPAAAHIDGADDGLAAEALHRPRHKLRVEHRSSVQHHLVGAAAQHALDLRQAGDAAAGDHRHEDALGNLLENRGELVSAPGAGNVQQRELVGAAVGEGRGHRHRIGAVVHVLQAYALDHAAAVDVQA